MDKLICADCIGNEYLAELIRSESTDTSCSYCGSTECDSLGLEFIAQIVEPTIETYWEDAANSVPYESAEGGYQYPTEVNIEVVGDILWECENPEIIGDISNEIPDTVWYHRHRYEEHDFDIWQEFCEFIKHKRRYFFSGAEFGPNFIPGEAGAGNTATDFLRRVIGHLRDFELVKILPDGTDIYRARLDTPNVDWTNPLSFGPPPADRANQSNRMSPVGIPVFYGAFDPLTAAIEINLQPNEECLLGKFQNLRELRYLDLSEATEIRSIFDYENAYLREIEVFISQFINDLSKPIARDDRAHVEYIPTQVVTEFFQEELGLDGIKFPSSLTGGDNWILFATQDDIKMKGRPPWISEEPWLELKDTNGLVYSIELEGGTGPNGMINVRRYHLSPIRKE